MHVLKTPSLFISNTVTSAKFNLPREHRRNLRLKIYWFMNLCMRVYLDQCPLVAYFFWEKKIFCGQIFFGGKLHVFFLLLFTAHVTRRDLPFIT